MNTTSRRGISPIFALVLVPAFLGLFFALFAVPLYLQRHVFPPDGRFVAGPVHGGLLFLVPAALVCLYFLFLLLFLVDAGQRKGMSDRPVEFCRLLCTGWRGWLTAAVLIGYFAVMGYGISAYWYATTDGLTVNPGWPADAVTFAWPDVTRRSVPCHRARGGPDVVFRVEMRGGQTVDLADTQQVDFAKYFSQIAALTQDADTQVGDVRNCPCFMRGFVQHWLQRKQYTAPEGSLRSRGDDVRCQ